MTSIEIRCPVRPSEDSDKVLAAVLAVFPDAELERTEDGFLGTAPGLNRFSGLIRKQKILDATRGVLMKNLRGNETFMSLNKQVATVGKVSFADRNPVLGAIDVRITDENIEALIDAVSPVTVDGEEVRT